VWKPPTGEDDFGPSFFEEGREDFRTHLLRKRGAMFHPTLLHWKLL